MKLEEILSDIKAVEKAPSNPQTQGAINQGICAALYGIIAYLRDKEEQNNHDHDVDKFYNELQ